MAREIRQVTGINFIDSQRIARLLLDWRFHDIAMRFPQLISTEQTENGFNTFLNGSRGSYRIDSFITHMEY